MQKDTEASIIDVIQLSQSLSNNPQGSWQSQRLNVCSDKEDPAIIRVANNHMKTGLLCHKPIKFKKKTI